MPLTPRAATAIMFFALGNALGFWSGAAATIVARVGIGDLTYGVALTLFTGAYLAAMSAAGAIAHRFTLKRTLDRRRSRRGADARRVAARENVVGYFILQAGFRLSLRPGRSDDERDGRAHRARPRQAYPRQPTWVGFGRHRALALWWAGLLAVSAAPWLSCILVIAALWAAAAVVVYAIPADHGDPVGAVAAPRGGLMSRTLVVIGLVIGVSIACESAAMAWSALVLRQEAPQWAALAGLGASFFAGCQACLRFNADRLRARVADRRLIADLARRCGARLSRRRGALRLRRQRRGLRDHRLRHWSGCPLRLRACRLAPGRVGGGRACRRRRSSAPLRASRRPSSPARWPRLCRCQAPSRCSRCCLPPRSPRRPVWSGPTPREGARAGRPVVALLIQYPHNAYAGEARRNQMRKCLIVAALCCAPTLAEAADPGAPPPAAPYNWTGAYLGVNGGGGWENTKTDYSYSSIAAPNPPGFEDVFGPGGPLNVGG